MPRERTLAVALPLEVDMRQLEPATVSRLFRARGRKDRVNLRLLYRTAWLHLAERIKAGLEPAPRRNVRGLWYRFGRPLSIAAGADERHAYGTFSVVLAELALSGLVSYSVFDMTDENWELRRIGGAYPDVILFAEKAAQFRLLRRVHTNLGVTVQAIGGQPSAVTSSILVEQTLEAMGRQVRPVQLVGLTDLDPWGWEIANTFRRHLEQLGLEVAHLERVVRPELFSAHELELAATPIVTRSASIASFVKRWLSETGGLDGEPMGVSPEALPHDRLQDAVVAATKGAIRRTGR